MQPVDGAGHSIDARTSPPGEWEVEFKNVLNKTRIAVLAVLAACVGFGASSTFAWGNTAQSGFDLEYFHTYRAARTYAIELQNGLAATFDFRHGTATLYLGPQQLTLPLDQVLLQAANGNSNLAAQMYNQMYGDITAAHSDAIMKNVETAGTHSLHPLLSIGGGGATGIGDQDDSMWGWPDSGDCFPVPNPCQQWPDGSSGPSLGTYTYWFNTPFGSDPLTNVPPNPDNCAPGNNACTIWENNRKKACNSLALDAVKIGGSLLAGAGACGSVEVTVGASTYACLGAAALYSAEVIQGTEDAQTCATPYPGP